MGRNTNIQWADDSLQLQSGCDGCELWGSKKQICYAGRMIDGTPTKRGFGGLKGWPERFDRPELFLDRLDPALNSRDLAGTDRPEKPWLYAELPRLIFLNDMGDTFSKKLPLDWLAPLLPRMAACPHRFLLLTKRPSRAVEFSQKHPFPDNFWIGTSVTSYATAGRVNQLRQVKGGELKFVSFEPLWSPIAPATFEGIQWAIFGGESGEHPAACDVQWISRGVADAHAAGARAFVKQLGGNAIAGPDRLELKDSHGGDWQEWPDVLKVREFPQLRERQPREGELLL